MVVTLNDGPQSFPPPRPSECHVGPEFSSFGSIPDPSGASGVELKGPARI
jgi:hypothetical protein